MYTNYICLLFCDGLTYLTENSIVLYIYFYCFLYVIVPEEENYLHIKKQVALLLALQVDSVICFTDIYRHVFVRSMLRVPIIFGSL